ncbi:hypothetical protein M9H77_07552 [Catharanthus roseus]|uniref:Uncharacterized protein n=1 Tax=Catharanthus roseus TaxID=4058 RepID=A0ACC0BVH9_CATRO|nr:hypothetical protein M9H77_07552 [Catharanthus roseus]
MSQLCKLEAQTEIKSSPDKFYDIYKKKTYLQLKIVPGKIQSIQVLEGDGETAGSIRLWTYIMVVVVDNDGGDTTAIAALTRPPATMAIRRRSSSTTVPVATAPSLSFLFNS